MYYIGMFGTLAPFKRHFSKSISGNVKKIDFTGINQYTSSKVYSIILGVTVAVVYIIRWWVNEMESTALTEKPTEDLERRARNILQFLIKKNTWLSAKDINSTFGYVHSTLWKTLKYLQGEGLIRSCRSLADTRITLYKVTSSEAPEQSQSSRMRAYV